MSYRVAGEGFPLLLLGGLSQWADQWWDVGYGDLLADRFRLIAVDRLGHGASDKPHECELYDERLIVNDLVAVLDAERVERALVWGFSLGAKNAASLAAIHGERVAAMVSGSVPALTRPEQSGERLRQLAAVCASREGIIETWQSYGLSESAVEEALERNDLQALVATALGTSSWWPNLEAITAPALWYIGTAEGGFYDEEVAYASAHDVVTYEVEGASHWATFSRAEEVSALVKPFLLRSAH